MAIIVDPKKLLQKYAPKSKVKKLATQRLSLKKEVLKQVSRADFLSQKAIEEVAIRTLRGYKERLEKDPELKASDITKDPKQLVQRVQNEVVLQITEKVRETYKGEYYIWLPSDAEEPDPEHQLNYGKKFRIDEGEMPGDRIGCRCGMEILVDETQLDI